MLDRDDHRKLIEDAIGDLDFSVLEKENGLSVVHRTYARALFEAAKEAGRLHAVREDLADFVEAGRQVPELDELLRNPQLDKRAKAAAVDAVAGGARSARPQLPAPARREGPRRRGRARSPTSSSGWPPPRRAS